MNYDDKFPELGNFLSCYFNQDWMHLYVFEDEKPSVLEIYRPRLVLADELSNLQFPTLSPDGKQIAYQAEIEDKRGELRVFNTESKQSALF